MSGAHALHIILHAYLPFLLGRYLEAYSKARTSDAITALGSLRPAEALILSPSSAFDSTLPAIVSHNDPEKCDVACDNGSLVASRGFKFEKVPVDLLEVGDVVRVQNGATPPSDGTIVSGAETSFDESSLTGEARLIKKNIGDKVLLGTINKSRSVDVRVDAIGGVTLSVAHLRFYRYCFSDRIFKAGSDRADRP